MRASRSSSRHYRTARSRGNCQHSIFSALPSADTHGVENGSCWPIAEASIQLMKRRPWFSLRFVFFGVTLCALLMMVWKNRPPRALRVELTARSTVLVNDEETELSSLAAVLRREWFVRRLLLMDPQMLLRTDRSRASWKIVSETIDQAQHVGFEAVTFEFVNDGADRRSVGGRVAAPSPYR